MVCPFASRTVSPGCVSFSASEMTARLVLFVGLRGGRELIIQLNSNTATQAGSRYGGSVVCDRTHSEAQTRGQVRTRIKMGKKGRKSCLEINGKKQKSNGQ